MIEIEENHNQDVIQAALYTRNGVFLTVSEWQTLIINSYSTRLWDQNWTDETKKTIQSIRSPNLIHSLSNAPLHIMEETVYKYFKKENDKEKLSHQLESYVFKYIIAIEYTKYQTNQSKIDWNHYNTTTIIVEHYSLMLTKAKLFINENRDLCQLKSKDITNQITLQTNPETASEYLKIQITPIINDFRNLILNINRKHDNDIETLLELITREIHNSTPPPQPTDEIGNNKRKPGRPKLDTNNNKNNNKNQSTLDQFLRNKR